MTRVAFDTCVLTWAIQSRHPEIPFDVKQKLDAAEIKRVEKLRENAGALVDSLRASRSLVAVPSVVLGELLCIIPTTHHEAVVRALTEGFAIYPLDFLAARMAGFLHRLRTEDGTYAAIKSARIGEEGLRAKLKVDTLLVATALMHRAEAIYSHDPDIKKIARGKIDVKELPPRPAEQTVIPEVEKLRPKPKA